MNGYTKLFGSIVASTIWREDNVTRIVWITMLALKNQHGIVEASIPGLADMARVEIDELKRALIKLSEPDEYSRTKEFEGRRIKEVPEGWAVLNHEKYRAKMNQDERREYLRVKQQEFRDRKSAESKPPAANKPVEPGLVFPFHSEAFMQKWSAWEGCRRALKKPKSWYGLFSEQLLWLSRFSEEQAIECLSVSIRNGYTGLFEPKAVASQSIQPSVFNLKTVMEQKQKLADQIRNEHSTTDALSTTWDDQANREKYRALRGEIKELSQKLAGAL
jgi:curved DNA-binding protein CbpA